MHLLEEMFCICWNYVRERIACDETLVSAFHGLKVVNRSLLQWLQVIMHPRATPRPLSTKFARFRCPTLS